MKDNLGFRLVNTLMIMMMTNQTFRLQKLKWFIPSGWIR